MKHKQKLTAIVLAGGTLFYVWIMYDFGVPWEIAVVNYVLLWAISFYVVLAEMG